MEEYNENFCEYCQKKEPIKNKSLCLECYEKEAAHKAKLTKQNFTVLFLPDINKVNCDECENRYTDDNGVCLKHTDATRIFNKNKDCRDFIPLTNKKLTTKLNKLGFNEVFLI